MHKKSRHSFWHDRYKRSRLKANPNCFKWDYRYLRYSRPLILLFNLLAIFLIYKIIGVNAISILVAVFFLVHFIKEFVHYFFMKRFEKNILNPIDMLSEALGKVADGKYDVQINYSKSNVLGSLIDSFNEMVNKLDESERMKKKYEENRKALLANISHDLKTPITSIQGYLEAVCEGTVPYEKQEKYLQIVKKNAQYMNKLIDDLFLFSKLDMDKADLKFEAVEIRGFARDLIYDFIYELEEMQITIKYFDNLEKETYANIDGKRFYQAVRNIIGNAVKYGPEDNLIIEVCLKKVNDSICLEITDNGPGIPEEKLPYIFERFYRVDKERTKDVMSTGLGLAIAKELIEAHNGTVRASNSVDLGACFQIFLPVQTHDEEVENDAALVNNRG